MREANMNDKSSPQVVSLVDMRVFIMVHMGSHKTWKDLNFSLAFPRAEKYWRNIEHCGSWKFASEKRFNTVAKRMQHCFSHLKTEEILDDVEYDV